MHQTCALGFNLAACTNPTSVLVFGHQSSSLELGSRTSRPVVAPGGVEPDQDRPPVGADCTRAEEERRQYGDEDSGSNRQQWGGGEVEGGDHHVH